jgi:hypothetical protein
MNYVLCLVISNCLSFVGFLLVVYYSIHVNRDSMLRISIVMTLLQITAYIIIGCFNAAVSSLFALLRSYICLRYPNRKEGTIIKAANLIVGTTFSMWCAYHGGGTWVAYLPAASFLFCSIGYYLTKSSSSLRIINALDIMLFWMVFDFVNMMVFYVVVDLFIVTFPIAERYVKLDRTDFAEHTQKSVPQNRAFRDS